MKPKRRIHLSLFLLLILFLCLGNFFLLHSPLVFEKDTDAVTNEFSTFMSSKGGIVVVFYHVPRTGGTTIRENMQPFVSLFRVVKPRDWVEAERRIANVFQGSGEKLLVELHGTIPGLVVLRERVQNWRNQSETSSVPLFTFTLVREPVSFSCSYFHHFHHPRCVWNWCERGTYPQDDAATFDENLLKTVVPNHQCKLLLLGQRESKKRAFTSPDVVTTERCQNELVPLLEQDWDWVGTTETLQTSTLPLLTRIMLKDENLGLQIMTKKNASKQRIINTSQLKLATTDRIRQQSSFDEELYERVRRERWRRKKTR